MLSFKSDRKEIEGRGGEGRGEERTEGEERNGMQIEIDTDQLALGWCQYLQYKYHSLQ